MWELPLEFADTGIVYVSLSLQSLEKDLFRELPVLKMCYSGINHHSRLNALSKGRENGKRIKLSRFLT